jgi:hypothetical protein
MRVSWALLLSLELLIFENRTVMGRQASPPEAGAVQTSELKINKPQSLVGCVGIEEGNKIRVTSSAAHRGPIYQFSGTGRNGKSFAASTSSAAWSQRRTSRHKPDRSTRRFGRGCRSGGMRTASRRSTHSKRVSPSDDRLGDPVLTVRMLHVEQPSGPRTGNGCQAHDQHPRSARVRRIAASKCAASGPAGQASSRTISRRIRCDREFPAHGPSR